MANHMEKLLEKLKANLTLRPGSLNEGEEDRRDNLLTGPVIKWTTTPQEVTISPQSSSTQNMGKVSVKFEGKEVVTEYLAGQEQETTTTPVSGEVTADYELTPDGQVSLTNVAIKHGKGRVGNMVARRMERLNGQML